MKNKFQKKQLSIRTVDQNTWKKPYGATLLDYDTFFRATREYKGHPDVLADNNYSPEELDNGIALSDLFDREAGEIDRMFNVASNNFIKGYSELLTDADIRKLRELLYEWINERQLNGYWTPSNDVETSLSNQFTTTIKKNSNKKPYEQMLDLMPDKVRSGFQTLGFRKRVYPDSIPVEELVTSCQASFKDDYCVNDVNYEDLQLRDILDASGDPTTVELLLHELETEKANQLDLQELEARMDEVEKITDHFFFDGLQMITDVPLTDIQYHELKSPNAYAQKQDVILEAQKRATADAVLTDSVNTLNNAIRVPEVANVNIPIPVSTDEGSYSQYAIDISTAGINFLKFIPYTFKIKNSLDTIGLDVTVSDTKTNTFTLALDPSAVAVNGDGNLDPIDNPWYVKLDIDNGFLYLRIAGQVLISTYDNGNIYEVIDAPTITAITLGDIEGVGNNPAKDEVWLSLLTLDTSQIDDDIKPSNAVITKGHVDTKTRAFNSDNFVDNDTGIFELTSGGAPKINTEFTQVQLSSSFGQMSITCTDEIDPNVIRYIFGFSSADFNGKRIKSLGSPVDGTDATNKNYVDSSIRELKNKIEELEKKIKSMEK